MSATGSPTARRRELGAALRSLRMGSELTTNQVAGMLGFSRSKISRLENGRRGASKADILRLCGLYQVGDEQRRRLTELAAEGKQRAWWQRYGLPYSDYIGLEEAASSISDYGLAIVPGLLQTPDYARAIVQAGVHAWEPKVVEERVEGRITRQQRRLLSRAGPEFQAVLDESVLHRIVGSPTVMLAQLKRLLEIADLPRVSIRVVPYDAGAVPAGVNKFIILGFEPDDMANVVLIEDLLHHRYIEQPEEVETYKATFRTLTSLAAGPEQTRNMICSKLDTYRAATC